MELDTKQEYCPACGEWVDNLRPDTGWCISCSPDSICTGCGRVFPADQESRTVCSSCRFRHWLEENADKIEGYMMLGFSYVEARDYVRRDNRKCRSCGSEINGGLFCVDKEKCRKLYLKYRYQRQKGLDVEKALREVLSKR